MKNFTMVARHGVSKDNISAYTLISSDYQIKTVDAASLFQSLKDKKIVVSNMGITDGKLTSTNGATDKYTFINTKDGLVEGEPKAVILDRVEQNGKLVGYTVFTQFGTIAEVKVSDAVVMVGKKLVSNGKIKHTQDGDIVSSIGGNYPLRVISIEKAPVGDINVEILFFSKILGTNLKYFGAVISSNAAASLHKITPTLQKSNSKITADVIKVAGDNDKDAFAIRRFGVDGYYGVFEASVLEKMVKMDNFKIGSKKEVKSIAVSLLKYDKNGELIDEYATSIDDNSKSPKIPKIDNEKDKEQFKEFLKYIASNFIK